MALYGIVIELLDGNEPSVFIVSDKDEEESTATIAPLSVVKEVFNMKRHEPEPSDVFAHCKQYTLKMKKKYVKMKGGK